MAYNIGIVGESYRQSALRKVSADRRATGVTFRVLLTAERDNSYDPNAIRVDADGVGHIGYLSADDAVAYKAVFEKVTARRRVAVCGAKLIGGTPGKPSLGAIISLDDPEELIARLQQIDDPEPF